MFALFVLVFLVIFLTGERGGAGRRELRRVQAERDLAVAALERIDQAADCIRDLDDPDALLASEVRQIVREYRNERPKIT